MTKKLLAILLALALLIGILPMGVLSAAAQETDLADSGFDPNNYKGKITKISVKEPYTKDGVTYLPMHVHFHVNDDISDSNTVWFMEGYNNVYMMDGTTAESLPGLGMTLMGPLKPDVPLEGNNMMIWTWNGWEQGGEGEVLYNVPLLESSDTQEITQSQATGLTEVNGVKPGDQIGFTLETVFNSSVIPSEVLPPGGTLVSDEFKVTVEDKSKYPKTYDAVEVKEIAPPAETSLTYNAQPQNCPYPDTDGYYASSGGEAQTDVGAYTTTLKLRSGWVWTDGSTGTKTLDWTMNPATLTSITLESNELTYNGGNQIPKITSVKAGDLEVPAVGFIDNGNAWNSSGYEISDPKSKYGGNYTLTVTGAGNFTGSVSANYTIVTITASCYHDGYEHSYRDNQDGETHSEYCDHCGQCINDKAQHNIVITYWRDPFTYEYLGTYSEKCTLCEYERGYTCGHADDPVWEDNGDGTHTQRCPKCKKAFVTEAHDIVTTLLKDGSGAFTGQYTESCSKCSYSVEKTCDHKDTGRTYLPVGDHQHQQECNKCKKLLTETLEDCTPDDTKWESVDANTHKTTCTHCTNVITAPHDCKGTRVITRVHLPDWDASMSSNTYTLDFKEHCKQCGVERRGQLKYKVAKQSDWYNWFSDLEHLVNMDPEKLIGLSEQWGSVPGRSVVMDFLSLPGISILSDLVTGDGDLQGVYLDYDKLLNDNGENVTLYDKNGNPIEMKKEGDSNKPDLAPTGGNGDDDEEEGTAVSDLYTARISADEPVFIAIGTEVLATLADGEHSLTKLITLDNGEQIAVTTYFTLATAANGERMVTSVRPEGAMVNADGDVVEMNLSYDMTAYTGEPIAPPAVTLTNPMGIEYAKDEDYTLTYYREVYMNGAEPMNIEVDPDNIVEIGKYTVVATPTRNGVLSGETWSTFEVIDPEDCPHNWETLYDETGHWQHCTICGMTSRIHAHEDWTVKSEIKRTNVPIDGGDDVKVLCVAVYAECDVCGYRVPVLMLNAEHSFDASGYPLATLRGAEINETGNAIYLQGDPDEDTYIFVDGVMVPDDCIDMVYGYISDEFLATIEDGDHEVTILNGENVTVMTVTVTDHKMTAVTDRNLADYEEIDYTDYHDLLTEYFLAGADFLYSDLDELLPILGDVDGDGEVSILDVTVLQRKLAKINVKSYNEWAADVDGSGEADTPDATMIQRWLAYMDVDALIGEPVPIFPA